VAEAQLLEEPSGRTKWTTLFGSENRLARLVARAPAHVHTKLLLSFLVIAGLLVVVCVLGLRVLAQGNARVERLGELQLRTSRYQVIEADANAVGQALGARAAGAPGFTQYTKGAPIRGGKQWFLLDLSVADVLSQVELALDEPTFGFIPPPTDERVLRRIRLVYRHLVSDVDSITRLDRENVTGVQARPFLRAADDDAVSLLSSSRALAEATSNETLQLIAQNRSAYTSSRDLFVAVGAASVVLALGLGLILSWSLVGPIQRTEARLAEIATGDFSSRVDVPNRDELGSLAANVNRMNDELRRLYGELETTSRHKSEFLANMSHELRTPLNAIIGFSQLLRQRLFGPINEKQEEYLDDILSSGNHLLALINDVLDLSKVEAGQLDLELADFSLREALDRGVVIVRERAVQNGVQVSLDQAAEVDVVRGDERRIRQVVFNLLSNAVKFTPAGGSVVVSTARVDGEVRVSVTDTGPGIAPEDHERIFEEFQQTEAGAHQHEGTGLGLALSRRLVELQGGRIWVESTQGQGARFVFTLPAGGA